MEVYNQNGKCIVVKDSPLSSGGEGEVREVISAPDSYPKYCCVKIYYKHKRSSQQRDKIQYMVSNPPSKVVSSSFMIGWPLALIYDKDKKFLGFIMPKAYSGSKELIYLTSKKISRKLNPEWHQRFERTNGKYSLLSRLKLINNIAIPVHILHSTKHYVFKDFKPQNVLITPDGKVTVVDMDSVQITDGSTFFPAVTLTAEYVPVEYYYKQELKKPNAKLNVSLR